jgi:hypothetical protein
MSHPMYRITCNRCGADNLRWRETEKGWRLFYRSPKGKSLLHSCGAQGAPPVPGVEHITEDDREYESLHREWGCDDDLIEEWRNTAWPPTALCEK